MIGSDATARHDFTLRKAKMSALQRNRNSPECNAQLKDRYRWPGAIQQLTDISTPRRT
jgi:hypothetical protein